MFTPTGYHANNILSLSDVHDPQPFIDAGWHVDHDGWIIGSGFYPYINSFDSFNYIDSSTLTGFHADNSLVLSDVYNSQPFVDAGWDISDDGWVINGVDYPYINLFDSFNYIDPTTLSGYHATQIEPHLFKKEQTYADVGWDFNQTWTIFEDVTFPRFGVGAHGKPGETKAKAVLVKVDYTGEVGTMFFQNIVFEHYKTIQTKDEYVGQAGEERTHVYFGDNFTFEGVNYRYIASGIQRVGAIGGYDDYYTDKYRTITLRDDSSVHVNFYYVDENSPLYSSYTDMYVHSPNGTFAVPLASIDDGVDSSTALRMFTAFGVVHFPLVDTNHEQASPLRVMTNHGIKSIILSS